MIVPARVPGMRCSHRRSAARRWLSVRRVPVAITCSRAMGGPPSTRPAHACPSSDLAGALTVGRQDVQDGARVKHDWQRIGKPLTPYGLRFAKATPDESCDDPSTAFRREARLIDKWRSAMVCSRGDMASDLGLCSHPWKGGLTCRFTKGATFASGTRRPAPASRCSSSPAVV
jgi:hypothetical protein